MVTMFNVHKNSRQSTKLIKSNLYMATCMRIPYPIVVVVIL